MSVILHEQDGQKLLADCKEDYIEDLKLNSYTPLW